MFVKIGQLTNLGSLIWNENVVLNLFTIYLCGQGVVRVILLIERIQHACDIVFIIIIIIIIDFYNAIIYSVDAVFKKNNFDLDRIDIEK